MWPGANLKRLLRRVPWWGWVVGGCVLVLSLVALRRSAADVEAPLVFATVRGPLRITVIEGGGVEAIESQEVKCEVRGSHQGVKILRIVDEGYQVTQEDIRTNKVLVELDSSELEKQLVEQEIRYQSSAASLAEAQQGYEIQLIQNLSDIKAAEQKARFARMDFNKFLGETAAGEILATLGLTNLLETLTNIVLTAPPLDLEVESAEPPPPEPALQVAVVATGEQPGTAVASSTSGTVTAAMGPAAAADSVVVQVAASAGGPPHADLPTVTEETPGAVPGSALPDLPPALLQSIDLDFGVYASLERLDDGEAKQKLRTYQDELMVARRELEQARSQQEGTRRLFEQQFVTRIDMERDDIALTNSWLKVQTAETAQELFLKYEFAKLAEQSLSAFLEAARELDRARRSAISKMAQADARLKSAQAQYNVQLRHRRELMEQLQKCVIRAEKTGLVVYGGGEERYWRGEEQIREGATVRERQTIITIPDMSKMSVKVKIHESHIKKVQRGQKARVTLDAFPDELLEGEVTQVAVLPDSEDRWMNPDMKVYRTTIGIHGSRDWLKPGMSAKAEILVDELPDVVHVPIQAVVPQGGKRLCYVVLGRDLEPREVEVGQFNDSFIEIKSGLSEGELVSLRPPGRTAPTPGGTGPEPAAETETETVSQPATTVTDAGPAA